MLWAMGSPWRARLNRCSRFEGLHVEPKNDPQGSSANAYHRHRLRNRFGFFGGLLSLARSYRPTGTVATIPAATICVSATPTLCTGAICTGAICTRAISSNPIICTGAFLKPTI